MATFTGLTGSVTYNSSTVAQVTSWELTTTLESADDTAMGEKWRGRTGVLASAAGRLTMILDYTTGQKEILDDLLAATPTLTGATCVLTIASGKTLTVVMIPTSVAIRDAADAIITLDVGFDVDGAVTLAWV